MSGATTGAGRRAVLLVANSAAPYSRGLRVARSLAAEGWEVEIAAVAEIGLETDLETGPQTGLEPGTEAGNTAGTAAPLVESDVSNPSVLIRRYQPGGPFARWATGRSGLRGRF